MRLAISLPCCHDGRATDGSRCVPRGVRAVLELGLLLLAAAGCGRIDESTGPTEEQRAAYRRELAEGQRLAAITAAAAGESASLPSGLNNDRDIPWSAGAGVPDPAPPATDTGEGGMRDAVGEPGPASGNQPAAAARGSMIETSRDLVQPHTQWSMEQLAADALGRIGPEAVPHLVLRLREPNPVARRRVAEILARIGPDAAAAVPSLTELLRDPDPTVQRSAVRALGQIGPAASAAVPHLLDLFIEAADEAQPADGSR
jgi:hypothetical protein